MNTTTAQATDAELIAALDASPDFVTVTDTGHLAELLGMDEAPEAPVTTEALSDIICGVTAWTITTGLDQGESLTWAVMGVPATEYRRERVTTWIREMGRPSAIAALRAYAKSPAQFAAERAAQSH